MKRILFFFVLVLVLGAVCYVLWWAPNDSTKKKSDLSKKSKNTVPEVKPIRRASTHRAKNKNQGNSQSTLNSIPKHVQPRLYGNDWLSDEKRIREIFPAIDNAVPITKKDISYCSTMPSDSKNRLIKAIDKYYENVNTVNNRDSVVEFKIKAARAIDGYILLWITEPNICDGGRSLIYSKSKNKIVGDFWDGGIRG